MTVAGTCANTWGECPDNPDYSHVCKHDSPKHIGAHLCKCGERVRVEYRPSGLGTCESNAHNGNVAHAPGKACRFFRPLSINSPAEQLELLLRHWLDEDDAVDVARWIIESPETAVEAAQVDELREAIEKGGMEP